MEEDGLGLSNGIDHAMNGIGSPTNSHHGPTLVRYVSGSRADMEIINPPTDHLTQSPTASQRRFSGNLSYAEVLRHSPTPDPDRPKHQREAPWLPEDPSAKKPKLDSTPESIPGSPDTAVAEAAEEATAMAAMMAAAASSGMPPQGEFSFNPPLSPSTAAGNGQKNLDGFMKKFLDSSASFPNTSSANGTKRPRRNSEILSLLSERESSMASLVQRVENLEKQAGIVNGQGQQNGKGAIGRGERKEKTTTVQYVHEPQWGWSVLLMAGAGLLGGWMGAAMESGRFKERVVNVLYRMVHPAETGSV